MKIYLSILNGLIETACWAAKLSQGAPLGRQQAEGRPPNDFQPHETI
jgi:hypothetical protein